MKATRRTLRCLAIALMAVPLCFAAVAPGRAAQDRAPRIIRKSGGVLQGSATRRVEPNYPPLARAARVSGSVVVEVSLDEEGNVIAAHAISGHPLLRDSAVKAAKGWTFSPTLLAGVAVKVIGTLTFSFHLDESNDDPTGIRRLEQQVEESPDSPELIERLGAAYLRFGQEEKAVEAFKQAIELKPDFAEAYSELGVAYRSLGRDDEALEAANTALTIAPKSRSAADANLLIGSILFKRDRVQDAIESFKRVLEIYPDPTGSDLTYAAHFGLAYAYVKAGDKESAVREYEVVKTRKSPGPDLAKGLKELIDAMP